MTDVMSMLRVVTLNLWGDQGPAAERMPLVTAGLLALAPDVVALQEVREVPPTEALPGLENQATTLGRSLGFHHVFAPATPWGGGIEGLAILSRFPIVEEQSAVLPASRPDETRVVLMAAVATPAGLVNCYSTHLHYRLTHGIEREQQVSFVDEFVRSHKSDFPQILMGDFNATPDHDEIRFLRGLCTLEGRRTYYQDAFAVCHPDLAAGGGHTWSSRNSHTDKLHFLARDRRIDYIFVTPMGRDGRGTIGRCEVVLDHASPSGCYPSDHFGLLAEVQITPTR